MTVTVIWQVIIEWFLQIFNAHFYKETHPRLSFRKITVELTQVQTSIEYALTIIRSLAAKVAD